jgi:hypothetical protein
MKKLYRAANLPDAHLLRGVLAQAGIEAHVLNENAQGGLGQLPFTEAWPEVWIAEERDLARAKEVVRVFEQAPAAAGALQCSGCGEENPSTFQLCWNCGNAVD